MKKMIKRIKTYKHEIFDNAAFTIVLICGIIVVACLVGAIINAINGTL